MDSGKRIIEVWTGKRVNRNLIIAIVWILISVIFFCMNKTGIGLCWLLVGIINLIRAIKTHQMNKKIQAINKHLTAMETIELSKEKHVITDTYSGYEYVINKAFKPVKSHAAEV